LSRRASVLGSLNRYDEAINPKDIHALELNAILLALLRKFDAAIGVFDNALAINANDTKIMTEKAGSLIALGRYIEAIGWLDKALSINPTLQEAAHLKVDAMQALKNKSSTKNG
jgi:tetratricopeptide (TPR) repeat protein